MKKEMTEEKTKVLKRIRNLGRKMDLDNVFIPVNGDLMPIKEFKKKHPKKITVDVVIDGKVIREILSVIDFIKKYGSKFSIPDYLEINNFDTRKTKRS